jgi:hypothetical protein
MFYYVVIYGKTYFFSFYGNVLVLYVLMYYGVLSILISTVDRGENCSFCVNMLLVSLIFFFRRYTFISTV